ncbi:MAG: DNA-binding NarL/FixJ family response regulator, partial [Cyclobacteriaceae bacterium]
MKKILIADDHSLFGSGLATLLENRGFEVVGQVLNGKDVIYKTISLQPDL